ncbi:MAG: hypothetical protein ACOVMR_05770 [Flavobacteriales bacterium]
MKSVITLLILLWSSHMIAQAPEGEMINFYGKITKMNLSDSVEKPLDGVKVEFWSDNKMLGEVYSAGKGKYSCNLPYRKVYLVKYGTEEYVQKLIEVDITKFYEDAEDLKALKMQVDVALFKDTGLMGLDFMNQMPMAKAQYIPRKKTLVWDYKHTEQMKNRILSVLSAYGY